ncbi:unnamed protein product, partial [Taenia asiatica]|uniref:BAR domain-containing protein n=1 Tax=Taenia asiatica TaxID=60517 RepID=A0A0R3WG61_TAEAS
MTSLYPHKGTEQALEIGMNALLCGNYLEQFSEVSRVGCSDDRLSTCGHLFCTESCKELVTKIRGGNTFLNDDYEDSLAWLNFKVQSRSALMSTDMKNSSIKGKSIQKSECARLENAKYLSDLTMLHLLAEEASLEAEIGFLNVCTEVKSIELDEAVIQGIVENLNVQCDYLKRVCLESIKKLACSDSLETSRLMFEYRKAHQMAHLGVRDRQIMEARLNCSKLEIFRDIMALEDSALAELTQCLDKIHTALQRYLDITTEIKTRFKSENELEGKENACATSPDSNAIDSELRAALVSLFG